MKEIKAAVKGRRKKEAKERVNPLFILLSFLANNNIVTTNIYVIFVVIEGFHFLYLPIQLSDNYSDAFSVFAEITSMVNYYRHLVGYGYELFSLLLMIIHMILIVLIISSGVAIVIIGSKLNLRESKLVVGLSMLMSSLIIIISTALIIPMLESFLFPVLCFSGERNFMNFGVFECGSISQIVLSSLGCFFALLTVLFFYIVNKVLVDDYWLSSLPWAGECKDVQLLQGIAKLLLGVYLGIDLEGAYRICAIGLMLLLQIAIIWRRIDVVAPYNYAVYASKFFQELVVLSVYCYSFTAMIYDARQTIWVLGLVILAGFSWAGIAFSRAQTLRINLLQKNWSEIKYVNVAENYVQVACSLFFIEQGSTDWSFFRYYLTHQHCMNCKGENYSFKMDISNSKKDSVDHWKRLFESILELISQKFPNSRRIMLQQSYFQCILMKNYFKSYYWLTVTDTLRTSDVQ